jgi:hypothetical protein
MFDAVNIKTSRRFWKCLKCPKESPFIGQIYRVEDHLMKLHTKLINLPYHCCLCTFRCQTWDDLVRHAYHFKPHQIQKQQLKKSGRWQRDAVDRIASKTPVSIQTMDIARMSREESQQWESDHARHPTYTPTFRPLQTEITTVTAIVEIHVPPKEIEMVISTPPQTPSCSPSIQNITPLSTPIRNILLKEVQNEVEEIALTQVVVPMESSLVINHHPAAEWSMISVGSPRMTGTCTRRTDSSTASTSSCHTSIPFKLFTDALDEVRNMMTNQTKDFSKHLTDMNNVIDRLTSLVTGLRSVVRDQAGEIRRLSSPPSFSVLAAINRARPQSVSRKYNFIFEIVSIESTANKNKNI